MLFSSENIELIEKQLQNSEKQQQMNKHAKHESSGYIK